MMDSTEMIVAIARAEGVMMALYGFCRDLAIGCSVDEDKNGKLGDVVGDAMSGLIQVYDELGKTATEKNITIEQAIGKVMGIIIEHGHHDKQFKFGDTIKYTPSEIGDILKEAVDNDACGG